MTQLIDLEKGTEVNIYAEVIVNEGKASKKVRYGFFRTKAPHFIHAHVHLRGV